MMSDKFKVILFMIIFFLILGLTPLLMIRSCCRVVDSQGGFREIIIETGKEIKSIKKEINKA